MSFFITERATEALLERETRDIPMPDGTRRPFTELRIIWEAWDFLVICGKYTDRELVELAARNSEEMGYPLEDSLPNVVAYLCKHVRNAMGID